MEAQQKNKLPQAGSGADTGAGESRPLTVSADRGCPSYSGGGDVLPKWKIPFARSGLLQRTPPKTTTGTRTRNETEQTETEDGISTGDEGSQCRRTQYASPMTFFSPMVSTPKNRGDWKRKKSPTSNKEAETLEEKEERLLNGLFDNIIVVNSLVDRQGPYKNTANEVKARLRELQKLCGRVMDVRRMKADKKDEEQERTPKRAKKAVVFEEKGTNTSTGGEMEELEWDDGLGTETEWKKTKTKSKQRRRKENKSAKDFKGNSDGIRQTREKTKSQNNDIPPTIKSNLVQSQVPNLKSTRNTLGKKSHMPKPEALLVEVKDRDYASVLKEVKVGLASDEVLFSKVRKTKRGDILLELEKGQDTGASQIKDKMLELCPGLTLRALKESAAVIVRGLDATVEREEVEESLKQKVKEFRIRSFWENNYGNKTVVVDLPKDEAQKLVDDEKIKIGWMRVRVRFLEEKKQCYRCLEYGHISTSCPGQDRSRKCYNCGNDGHKAKECENEAACAICKDKGQVNLNHRMGSKKCPSWNEKVPGRRTNQPKNAL